SGRGEPNQPASDSASNPSGSRHVPSSPEQCAMIPQNHPGGVVAGGTGDAASGMGAAAAMIKSLHRRAVIGVAEHRAGGEQLVQRQCAMKDVAAQKPELALKIER